jgi:hypothetical protein
LNSAAEASFRGARQIITNLKSLLPLARESMDAAVLAEVSEHVKVGGSALTQLAVVVPSPEPERVILLEGQRLD